MQGVAVAVLTEDKDRRPVLRHRVDTTQAGSSVFSYAGFPVNASDSILRQIQDVHAEVVLADIDPRNEQRALAAIELIKASTNDLTIFAVGTMTSPNTIVSAMRAGAGEYLERESSAETIADHWAVSLPLAIKLGRLPEERAYLL